MQQHKEIQANSENNLPFQKKVWIIVGIIILTLTVLLVVKAIFRVLLLILAGTLIAVFFRVLSAVIQCKTKWNEGVCVALSVIDTLLIVTGLFWSIGAKVQGQIAELIDTLPKTIDNVKTQLNSSAIGEKMVINISSDKTISKAAGVVYFQT